MLAAPRRRESLLLGGLHAQRGSRSTGQWFGRTVILSDRRFTYEEAQQIIETGKGDFAEEVLTLNRLAQRMRKTRFKRGAVSFQREEAKFKLDAEGKPLGVYFKEQRRPTSSSKSSCCWPTNRSPNSADITK